ncbi:MAG: phosphomannomutase/phosphoglucomutase [Pseudomonadales bacterium]
MKKPKSDDDAPRASASARRPARGGSRGGIWSHALLVIGLSLTGLVVAMAVIAWQVVTSANAEHEHAVQQLLLEDRAAYFDGQIEQLQKQVNAIATAPETVAAMASFDPERLRAESRRLTETIGFADRVELFQKGTSSPELDAPVPITFAANDVIRRAENQPFVGPEGTPNQNTRTYVAQPVITPDGLVGGVLFVAVSGDYFLGPLRAFDNTQGQTRIEQRFDGSPAATIMELGDPGTGGTALRKPLATDHWTLVFTRNPAQAATVASNLHLLTGAGAALALMLGGVLFGFSSLARKLNADADALSAHLSRVMRGRPAQPERFHLPQFDELAREAGSLGRPGAAAPQPAPEEAAAAPAPARRKERAAAAKREPQVQSSQADAVDDLLDDGEDSAPRGRSSDFLEISSAGSAQDNFGIEVSEEEPGPLDMGLKLEAEIFRAYDIRGITSRNLTEDVVYWIGRAFAAEARALEQGRVAVGRDGRHSSLPLRDALVRGLTDGGVDVLDVGQVPTPLLYFATHSLDTGTGIMITGSHNPPEYNGLKMVLAGETLAEDRIQALRRRNETNDLSEGEGDIEQVDLNDHYLDRILDDVVVAQPLKIVVDCGNGVAGAIAPQLIEQLGCEVVKLYCDVDGDFPNHHPDPADPANLEDLITVVKAEKADLGLAFDGDGDRLGVVTGSGEIVWPDKLLMLFAQDIVGRNPGADIIYDVKCSRHLNGLISDLGGRPIMWRTGHSHMKAKLKETGALLAGEFSGHICFGERWYGFDDALYSAARLLEILGASEQTADELFAQFPVTYSTPEIKVTTTETAKFDIMKRLGQTGDFGQGTVTTIDGVRVDYEDGWGLVRPSNTSPVLTLRFEADAQEALERIQDVFQAQLTAIDPKLRFR